MNALVRGVTVYMVVIEGTLALTGARFIIRSLKQNDWLPGFRQGFTAVNRDESRHVGFGVKFLADAIKEDERYKQTVADTLKETLPVGTLALAPPMVDDPYDFVTPFGYTSAEIYEYAMRSLSKKLAAMGMEPIGAPGLSDARRRPGAPAGRPPGARERILEPRAWRCSRREGYAGLTTAKVAARSGQNKALISYHFGSKQGLVAAVGPRGRQSITDEVVGGHRGPPTSVEGIVAGRLDGLWRLMDRDERLARLYFDLTAVSVVEPDVRSGDAGDQGRLARRADRPAGRAPRTAPPKRAPRPARVST